MGSAFLPGPSISSPENRLIPIQKIVAVNLLPLSRFSADLAFFSEDESYRLRFDEEGILSDGDDKFELAIVQEDDLPDLSRFIVAAFGADAIRLSQDINAFERMMLSPATELVNGYSNLVAFAEVFQGTRQRLKSRFEKMDLSAPNPKGLTGKAAIDVVEKDSLVLVVARPSAEKDSQIEVIASIELRLQVSSLDQQFRPSTYPKCCALMFRWGHAYRFLHPFSSLAMQRFHSVFRGWTKWSVGWLRSLAWAMLLQKTCNPTLAICVSTRNTEVGGSERRWSV